jgi:hypothetical protein
MPPKRTTPVAPQKCGRCFKIHAPPLGEQCLALLLADEDKLQNSDETSEDSTHVDGQELEQQLLGAVGGSGKRQCCGSECTRGVPGYGNTSTSSCECKQSCECI